GGGTLRRRRRKDAQRANLAAVEADEHRHLRLLAAIERIDELTPKDAAVDREEREVPRLRGRIRDCLRIHRTQARQVARADLAGKPNADRFRGNIAMWALAQMRRRDHVTALHDCLCE